MTNKRKKSQKTRVLFRKCLKRVYDLLLQELAVMVEEERNQEKRIWVKDWIRRGDTHGASALLLTELALVDTKEYLSFLRLTPENFDVLFDLILPKISKINTQLRDALPGRLKFEVTLSYLATGNSFRSIQPMFRVSKAAMSIFTPEVCDAIHDSLKEFIRLPKNHEEWKAISEGFAREWNFPNCCGAIDGKHFLIQAPPESGSQFFNYKKTHSVVLMAVVASNYCFTYTEVGYKGSENDAGIFLNGLLWKPLENGLLPDGSFLVGDDAFPLKPYLMKPYTLSKQQLTPEEMIFNYRLSRPRRIVENAFGILVSRFRVFQGKALCKVSTVPKLINAACALHKWLRKNSPATYFTPGSVDEEVLETGHVVPGRWREEIGTLRNLETFGGRRTTKLAKKIRDGLKTYFNHEGAVLWQNK